MSEHDLEIRALATILSTGLSDERGREGAGLRCVACLQLFFFLSLPPPPTLFVCCFNDVRRNDAQP